jgi:hypothetical protein
MVLTTTRTTSNNIRYMCFLKTDKYLRAIYPIVQMLRQKFQQRKTLILLAFPRKVADLIPHIPSTDSLFVYLSAYYLS